MFMDPYPFKICSAVVILTGTLKNKKNNNLLCAFELERHRLGKLANTKSMEIVSHKPGITKMSRKRIPHANAIRYTVTQCLWCNRGPPIVPLSYSLCSLCYWTLFRHLPFANNNRQPRSHCFLFVISPLFTS